MRGHVVEGNVLRNVWRRNVWGTGGRDPACTGIDGRFQPVDEERPPVGSPLLEGIPTRPPPLVPA